MYCTEPAKGSYLHRTRIQRAMVHHHLRKKIQFKRSHGGTISFLFFFFKTITLNWQIDQQVVVNSSLYTCWIPGVGNSKVANIKRREKQCEGNKPIHMEIPSTGTQNTANKIWLGTTLVQEGRGAQVTDTKWQAFRLAFQVLGLSVTTAWRSLRQRADGITGDRESNDNLGSHNQSADDPRPLWTFLLGQQIWLQRQINRVSDWWW